MTQMDVLRLLPKALVLFVSVGAMAQQRLTDQQSQLVHTVAKQAAFAEVTTGNCAQRDARNAANYQRAWQSWQQRNHWPELQAGAAAAELQPGEYDQLKANTQKVMTSQNAFRMAMICAGLPKSLMTPQFDSSATHGQEIAAIVGMGGGAAGGASPSVRPPAAAGQVSPNGYGVAQSAPSAAVGQNAAPAYGGGAPQAALPAMGAANVSLQGVQFAAPAGWAAGKSGANSASYVYQNKGEVIIVSVMPMQSADVAAAFRANVHATFPAPDAKLQHVEVGKTAQGLAAASVSDGGKLAANQRYTSLRAVGIAMPGNRMLLLEYVARGGASDTVTAEKGFQAMVRTVRVEGAPVSEPWDVMHPPKGSGGMKGLFWTTQLQNMINPLGGMDLRANRYYVTLLPNGQVYADLPKGGHVFDMDFAAAVAKSPQDCGTYRVSGGVIHYIFPNQYGLLIESEGKVSQTSVEHDGRSLTAVRPVQGMQLSGKYSATFAMVNNGVTMSATTSVSSTHVLAFSPDGSYARTGSSGASGSAYAISNKNGVTGGRYQINGYTLTLTPAGGGPPEVKTVVFEDANPSPKAIWIDDEAYLRDGH